MQRAAKELVLAALVVSLVGMADVSDALVLCPTFPRCCYTNSCWTLCPSCREARYFINGIRIKHKEREPCPDTLRFIFPDPFAFPEEEIFPEEPFCIEEF